jgi:protein ImuB
VPAPADGELPQASQAFDFPLSLTEAVSGTIGAVLERLVAECVGPLTARGAGVLALQVRLERATVSRGADAAPTVIDVGLFRPSTSVRHIVELVHLRLGRMRLPREIDGITVDVVSAAAARCRQQQLFDGEATATGQPLDVDLLCDRLSGRLGRAAVFEPGLVADAQPEHAWLPRSPAVATATPRSAGGRQHGARAEPRGVRHAAAGLRPIWMPPRPVRLEPLWPALAAGTVHVSGDGPGPPPRFRSGGVIHEVLRSHGPERIETAWWRGPIVRRDYYVVETATGARFWLFRRLRDGGWFLHGVFA